jgi:hypothetical protein
VVRIVEIVKVVESIISSKLKAQGVKEAQGYRLKAIGPKRKCVNELKRNCVKA